MNDSDLRALERAHAAAPTPETRDRLESAWLRAGRGWYGEEMPLRVGVKKPIRLMRASVERGVYDWHVAEACCTESGCTRCDGSNEGPRNAATIQMVYVPGGEVECSTCAGHGETEPGRSSRCVDCRGTGRRTIAPFYVARFPTTWAEWHAHMVSIGEGTVEGERAWQASGLWHRPVYNVSLGDARAFCGWAGLELPDEGQWRWAALGPPRPCDHYSDTGQPYPTRCMKCSTHIVNASCLCSIRGEVPGATRCVKGCREPRVPRCPWGNAPPSPERCAWAGHPEFGVDDWHPEDVPPLVVREGSTAPVVEERCALHERPRRTSIGPVLIDHACSGCWRLAPARLDGASWCGAHDTFGNVHELCADGLARGGSFRSDLTRGELVTGPVSEPRDDVGFRVVLSTKE